VQLPITERIKILLDEYPHFTEDTTQLKFLLSKLIPLRGHELVNQWNAMINAQQWGDFVQSILENHYDLCYRAPGSEESNYKKSTGDVIIPDATVESFTKAAEQTILQA
jgi:tRNA 2-selenouridine synthase